MKVKKRRDRRRKVRREWDDDDELLWECPDELGNKSE